MAATIYSAAVTGPDAKLVTIETRVAPGLGYLIVGLPDPPAGRGKVCRAAVA